MRLASTTSFDALCLIVGPDCSPLNDSCHQGGENNAPLSIEPLNGLYTTPECTAPASHVLLLFPGQVVPFSTATCQSHMPAIRTSPPTTTAPNSSETADAMPATMLHANNSFSGRCVGGCLPSDSGDFTLFDLNKDSSSASTMCMPYHQCPVIALKVVRSKVPASHQLLQDFCDDATMMERLTIPIHRLYMHFTLFI